MYVLARVPYIPEIDFLICMAKTQKYRRVKHRFPAIHSARSCDSLLRHDCTLLLCCVLSVSVSS